jgi:hypothetical protein
LQNSARSEETLSKTSLPWSPAGQRAPPMMRETASKFSRF